MYHTIVIFNLNYFIGSLCIATIVKRGDKNSEIDKLTALAYYDITIIKRFEQLFSE